MTVHSSFLRFSTKGNGEMLDLTDGVARVVLSAGVSHGVTTVFAVGATVAVTTIEFEPGGVADFAALLERLVQSAASMSTIVSTMTPTPTRTCAPR